MAPLKSEVLEDSKPLHDLPAHVRDELDHWKNLTFSFDMDHNSSGTSRSHGVRSNQGSHSAVSSTQSASANRVSKYCSGMTFPYVFSSNRRATSALVLRMPPCLLNSQSLIWTTSRILSTNHHQPNTHLLHPLKDFTTTSSIARRCRLQRINCRH